MKEVSHALSHEGRGPPMDVLWWGQRDRGPAVIAEDRRVPVTSTHHDTRRNVSGMPGVIILQMQAALECTLRPARGKFFLVTVARSQSGHDPEGPSR
jgi:hypothetical protein